MLFHILTSRKVLVQMTTRVVLDILWAGQIAANSSMQWYECLIWDIIWPHNTNRRGECIIYPLDLSLTAPDTEGLSPFPTAQVWNGLTWNSWCPLNTNRRQVCHKEIHATSSSFFFDLITTQQKDLVCIWALFSFLVYKAVVSNCDSNRFSILLSHYLKNQLSITLHKYHLYNGITIHAPDAETSPVKVLHTKVFALLDSVTRSLFTPYCSAICSTPYLYDISIVNLTHFQLDHTDVNHHVQNPLMALQNHSVPCSWGWPSTTVVFDPPWEWLMVSSAAMLFSTISATGVWL